MTAQSKHIDLSHLSEQQLQELRSRHRRLRRLNRAILVHMARIRWHSSDQQRELGKFLEVDASQINSLVEFCERIKASDEFVPRVLTINFVCAKCHKEERPERRSQSLRLPSSLDLDPGWMAEIDRSLELVRRLEERTFLRCLSHGYVADRLFSSLTRVRKALLRQKSHVIAIRPEQTMPAMELKQDHTCICNDRSTGPN